MSIFSHHDPIDRLSRNERRSWRAIERRARREHEAEQMAVLRSLAATGVGVTGLRTPELDDAAPNRKSTESGTPVEMIINGRRLRAGRVQRRTLSSLREALSGIATVPLTAVGRYGPYWVLTFKVATEYLVVLADQLTLLPDWGGPGGRSNAPTAPLAGLTV